MIERIIYFVCFLVVASVAQARDMVPADVAASIRAAYPNTKIDSIRLSEFPGIYELVMGKNIAYTAHGLPYILIGNIYDTRTGKDLTAERAAQLKVKISWDDLPIADAIKRGSGGKKVAVFSDPDCPYCRKLEEELAKLSGIEVYIFMYPVESLHPGATQKARSVWCAEDKVKAWDTVIAGGTVKSKECDAAAVDRNISLAQVLGINGTPALIREDGEIMEGVRPARVLASWLGVSVTESVAVNATKTESNVHRTRKGGSK